MPPWGVKITSWHLSACPCWVLTGLLGQLLVHFNAIGGKSYFGHCPVLSVILWMHVDCFVSFGCLKWCFRLAHPGWPVCSRPSLALCKAGMKNWDTNEQSPCARSRFWPGDGDVTHAKELGGVWPGQTTDLNLRASRKDGYDLYSILVQDREGPRNSFCISTAGFLNYCLYHQGHSFPDHLDYFYITAPLRSGFLSLRQSPPSAV